MATSNRRMGAKSSETRAFLLDIAETIMREDGYAAVTSRQLAKSAQMSPQIVYYYFKTMDELFEALFAHHAAFFDTALEEAAKAEDPILAIWETNSDPSHATLITEFMALANHRKTMAGQISDFGRRYHARQAEIIGAEIARREIALGDWTPSRIATVLENLARAFALGGMFEIEAHIDARDFLERRLSEMLGAAGR